MLGRAKMKGLSEGCHRSWGQKSTKQEFSPFLFPKGSQPTGLVFFLDAPGLGFRAADESRSARWWAWCPSLVSELAPLSWSPRLGSAEPQARVSHHLHLEL